MSKNIHWTPELKKELMDFFEKAKKNECSSVTQNSENFAEQHEGMTPSQVKSAYYKFSSEGFDLTPTNAWTEKQNDELMNAIEKRKGTMADVFRHFGEKYNRPYKSVSQHYYFLTRVRNNTQLNIKKHNAVRVSYSETVKKYPNVNAMMKDIKKMPKKTFDSLSHIVAIMSANN